MGKTYREALHAMQSGVALEMRHLTKDTEPKHLRVGINSAFCDHAVLVKLLMDKGIITEMEYAAAITQEMNEEVARYEERLSVMLNTKITLG